MLKVYTLDNIEEWDSIVRTFEDRDVYYLPEYVKGFEVHGDGEPLLFYFDNGELEAINVVMKRDISEDKNFKGLIMANTYYDLSTPYGYGGFIYKGNESYENLEELNSEYTKYCVKYNIISEFVRFHPVLNNAETSSLFYTTKELGKTITMELGSQEQVWNNLKSKNRNVIRKSTKTGVKIYWSRDIALLETFIGLYNSTMDRDNATEYYFFHENFYKSILNDLKYNMMFFYAVYNNKIVSMAMILMANKRLNYHLSASDPEYNTYSPSNLLLNEVANWGVENGFTTFHLGGGLGSKEDSLFKFKSAFNRYSDTKFTIGQKIFNEDIYNKLNMMLDKDKDNNFFPAYRR